MKTFVAVVLFCLSAMVSESAAPPNVVVFLVDDLGYMDVGVNTPNCFYDTPNIDWLAKSGIRFADDLPWHP